MFDHEYTLVAHPRLRAKLSYRSEAGDLAAATVRLDYRRDREWTEAGTAVELPEHPEEAGFEWRGLHVSLYRDGEPVVARRFSSSLLSNAVDLLEDVGPAAVRRGRDAGQRVTSLAKKRPIEMPQLDGTAVEALRPPAKAGFEVYEGKDGKWRWRLVHDNGNVIADSGQGYSSARAAEKGIRSVKRNALGAAIERTGGETERDVRSGSDAENEGSETGSAES